MFVEPINSFKNYDKIFKNVTKKQSVCVDTNGLKEMDLDNFECISSEYPLKIWIFLPKWSIPSIEMLADSLVMPLK